VRTASQGISSELLDYFSDKKPIGRFFGAAKTANAIVGAEECNINPWGD
jgi:hypothetical protein